MSLRLYFDQHMQGPIAAGLRQRGIDVLTAENDGMKAAVDDMLLARASELGRIFVTNDEDFTTIAASWQTIGRHFAGVVYMTRQLVSYGRIIDDLQLIAEAYNADERANRVEYIPF